MSVSVMRIETLSLTVTSLHQRNWLLEDNFGYMEEVLPSHDSSITESAGVKTATSHLGACVGVSASLSLTSLS